SVTLIHDTIPLRYGALPSRLLKRLFLLLVSRLSAAVLTDSEHSRRALVRDLRMRPEQITVLRFPIDEARAHEISRMRAALSQEGVLLYVGRFAPHKNLHRLCRAFRQSAFGARGGTLTLAGGAPAEVARMRWELESVGITGVTVLGHRSEPELD